MALLTLRSIKGSPLSVAEVDSNFIALNTELGTKLDAATYTPNDILTKLLTVDGAGSGLDANLLNGASSSTANTPNTVVLRNSSGNFSAGTITATVVNSNLNGNVTGNLTGNSNGTHTGPVVGAVTGNVTGNTTGTHTGPVVGDVTGSASLNILRSGDNMTGRLGLSSSGLRAAAVDNIATRVNSGFYENSTPAISKGWPADGGWYHLLTSTHTNDTNYYSMQFSGDFYNSNNVFYRITNNNGLSTWSRLWHSNNDGAGTGLDADLLDGYQSSILSNPNTVAVRDSSSNITANVFNGTATRALYADLAEKYTMDEEYPVGTVVAISINPGSECSATTYIGQRAIGVISENPAFLMNSDAEGQAVALKGRVPVRVIGPVTKGTTLSAGPRGCAIIGETNAVAIALESNDSLEEKLVECFIL